MHDPLASHEVPSPFGPKPWCPLHTLTRFVWVEGVDTSEPWVANLWEVEEIEGNKALPSENPSTIVAAWYQCKQCQAGGPWGSGSILGQGNGSALVRGVVIHLLPVVPPHLDIHRLGHPLKVPRQGAQPVVAKLPSHRALHALLCWPTCGEGCKRLWVGGGSGSFEGRGGGWPPLPW